MLRPDGLLLCSAGGSFRHFLWQVCKELQSSSLSLLLLCPSSAVNKNKVRSRALATHLPGPWGSFDAPLTEHGNWTHAQR